MTDLNRDRIDPDKVDVQPWTQIFSGSRTDWVDRQNATQCEACGRSDLPCHVHHVRGMADVAHRDQATRKAIARARKTKVLCVPCHKAIHGGPLPEQRT
ncbi:hypothetical protein [Bosea sp. (in: a-proteobacteria)]